MPKKAKAQPVEAAKKKYIKLTVDLVIEAVDGNVLDSASHAEHAVSDYLHDWLSDSTTVVDLDTTDEEYEE